MPVVTDQLAAQYLLREGSGTTAHDTSGNGHDGTLQGTAAWDAHGVTFASISDNILLPDATLANDNATATAVSIEAWINASTEDGWLVDFCSDDLGLYTSRGSWEGDAITTASFSSVVGNTATVLGAWTHLVFTFDGAECKLYINGILDSQNPASGGAIFLDSSNGPKYLGGSSRDGSIVGTLGEVRIYSKALSDAEVTNNYDSTNTYPATAPVITSFTATPTPIAAGQLVTLSWSVGNATSVSIDQGIGSVSASGTQQVSPTVTTTYTLTAVNSADTTTATVTVVVGDTPATQQITLDNGTQTMAMRTIADGPNLWSFGHSISTSPYFGTSAVVRPVVYKSTNGGQLWTEQDPTHPSVNYTNDGDLSGSMSVAYDETNKRIWFGYFHFVTQTTGADGTTRTFYSFFEFQTFDVTTGIYSSVFGSGSNTTGLYYDVNYPYQENPIGSSVHPRMPRRAVGLHLLDPNTVLVFTQTEQATVVPPSNGSLNYDLQLQASTWSFTGSDPTAGTWSVPIANYISENCPTGTVADGSPGSYAIPVEVCCLGGASYNGSFYFFYNFAQINYPALGQVTEAVYMRSIDAGLAVSTPIIVSAGSLCNHGDVITQRVQTDPPTTTTGFFNGMNPLDPRSGQHFHSWLSFRYCYVRSGVLYSTAVYNHPTLGYTPCVIAVNLTTNAITYTPISSTVAGLWEAVVVQSGTTDIVAVTQEPSGSSTHKNLLVGSNSGSGWGALTTLNTDTAEINYPWPVQIPGSILSTSYWISQQTRFVYPYPYGTIPKTGLAFMFSRLSNLHLAFPATSPGSYIT